MRMLHEAKLHPPASCYFVTLTYDDAHLPDNWSLVYRHVQLFFKRLRKATGPFRYFVCGEYGDQGNRPHYHVCFFGLKLPDVKPLRLLDDRRPDIRKFRSETLAKAWGLGFVDIGTVTPASARYAAAYCVKKVTGDLAAAYYAGREPEFARMSTSPGLGAGWFHRHGDDYFRDDFCVVDGKRYRVPKYYAKLQKRGGEARVERLEEVLHERHVAARVAERVQNSTPDRLAVREQVATAKHKLTRRSL